MQPIPQEAMPVVKILRRDVPRLPNKGWAPLCTYYPIIPKVPRLHGRCPLGFHPLCTVDAPYSVIDFLEPMRSEISTQSMAAFYHWWDSLDLLDLDRGLDSIWPPTLWQRICRFFS